MKTNGSHSAYLTGGEEYTAITTITRKSYKGIIHFKMKTTWVSSSHLPGCILEAQKSAFLHTVGTISSGNSETALNPGQFLALKT